MEGTRIFNVPNSITLMRIGFMVAFVLTHFLFPDRTGAAVACFAAAGFTDFADGMAARKLHQVTKLGTLLDPIADKMMVISALVCLAFSGITAVWVPALVFIKEMYMIMGAAALLKRGIVIPADFSGKTATLLFVPSVILAYPWHGIRMIYTVGRFGVYGSVLLSVCSAAHYTWLAVKKSDSLKTH